MVRHGDEERPVSFGLGNGGLSFSAFRFCQA
jgi:hypothetical protein